MSTLTEYLSEQIRDFDETIQNDLQNLAATQNADALSYRTQVATAQNECLRLERDVAAKRRVLAEASPSDGAKILADLRDLSVQHRRAQAKVLEQCELELSARAELNATFAALERERKRRTEAQKTLAAATDAEKVRTGAREKLAEPPLATLVADALAAKAGVAQQEAWKVIEIIPAELRDLAQRAHAHQRQRLSDRAALASAAAAARDAARFASEGTAGNVAVTARAFRDTERVLLQFTGYGASELARAEALFVGVTAAAPLLSDAEKADTEANDPRKDAATLAGTLMTADSALEAASIAYETALRVARAPAPYADVSTAVAAQQATLTDADTAFRAAQQALAETPDGEASAQTNLDGWTCILGDLALRKLRDYHDALAILEELTQFPSNALAELDAAESAYATALADEVAAQRTRAFLEDREAIASAQLALLQKQSGIRLISAMRCDFLEARPPMAVLAADDDPVADVPVAEDPFEEGPDDALDVPEVA